MLRNLGIRWQILAALALPLLVLVAVSGRVTYQSVQDMHDAQEALDLSSTASSVSELVRGLSSERLLTVSALSGSSSARSQLATVRSANDVRLQRIGSDINSSGVAANYRAVLTSSAAGHARLGGLRAAVDAGTVSAQQAADQYTGIVGADVNLPAEIAARLSDRATAASFRRFGALNAGAEALGQEQLTGLMIAAAGEATLFEQRQLAASQALQRQLIADFGRGAPAEQRAALSDGLASQAGHNKQLEAFRARFLAAGTSPMARTLTGGPGASAAGTTAAAATAVDPSRWVAITGSRIDVLDRVLDTVARDGVTDARNQLSSARLRAQVTAGASAAAVLIMLLAAMLMARRISQPLRRLTLAVTEIRDGLPQLVEQVQAGADAEIETPDVPDRGRNEVGRLAAAFVDVNRVTVQVAREQAQLRAAVSDTFVNVARRNQVLLARQLAFIDQLERNEANPDALEELFRLDHLATRMRRNAESLLVLAGIESGRRLREPMLLSDVIRTAISEIEHYERVSLALGTDPPVFAHLALPVAHLLAELLENATNFSEPGSTVVVMAATSPEGVRVTVADDGLGIAPDELDDINQRIENPPAADALGSQRLGFFVVGRLAQRLEATVLLTSGRAGGTAVLIDLPAALFVTQARPAVDPERQIVMAPELEEAEAALALEISSQIDRPGLDELLSLDGDHFGGSSFTAGSLGAGFGEHAEAAQAYGVGQAAPVLQPPIFPAELSAEAYGALAAPEQDYEPEIPAPTAAATGPAVPATDLADAGPDIVDLDTAGYQPLSYEPRDPGTLTVEHRADPQDAGLRDDEPMPFEPREAEFQQYGAARTPASIESFGVTPVADVPAPSAATNFFRPRPAPEPAADQFGLPIADSSQAPAGFVQALPAQATDRSATPVAGLTGSSLFSGFRSRREPAVPAHPETVHAPGWLEAEPSLPDQRPSQLDDLPPLAPPASRPIEPMEPIAPIAPIEPVEPVELIEPVVKAPALPDEPAPWENFIRRDILPQKPASLRDALRFGRRAPAPSADHDHDVQPQLLPGADEPAPYHPGDASSVPLMRRYRDDGAPRPTQWPATGDDLGAAEQGAGWPETFGLPADLLAGTNDPAAVPAPRAESGATTAGLAGFGAPGAQTEAQDRSHIASQALSELSRLSSYRPAAVETSDRGGLQRRTPAPVPRAAEPAVQSSGQRARTAANVRSMLSGFKAGVERGRTSPRSRTGPADRARDDGGSDA